MQLPPAVQSSFFFHALGVRLCSIKLVYAFVVCIGWLHVEGIGVQKVLGVCSMVILTCMESELCCRWLQLNY